MSIHFIISIDIISLFILQFMGEVNIPFPWACLVVWSRGGSLYVNNSYICIILISYFGVAYSKWFVGMICWMCFVILATQCRFRFSFCCFRCARDINVPAWRQNENQFPHKGEKFPAARGCGLSITIFLKGPDWRSQHLLYIWKPIWNGFRGNERAVRLAGIATLSEGLAPDHADTISNIRDIGRVENLWRRVGIAITRLHDLTVKIVIAINLRYSVALEESWFNTELSPIVFARWYTY